MTFLSLKSNNPDLSWVIQKSPETKLIAKHVRQGFAFGWFSAPGQYNCHFVDPPDTSSYSNEEFSYLDTTGFTSPYSYLNLISEFFRSAVKELPSQDLGGYVHSLTFNYVSLDNPKYVDIFSRLFANSGFKFSFEERTKEKYEVNIITDGSKTIHELLNLGLVFMLFAALFDRNGDFRNDDDLLEKYLDSLKVAKVPYFITYLFKINFIKSPEKFEKFGKALEEATQEICTLVYGNTLENRKDFVRQEFLKKPTPYLIDVGVGKEFNYKFLLKLLPELETKEAQYFPIDSDLEVRESVNGFIERRGLTEIGCAEKCFASFAEFTILGPNLPDNSATILCTEVLEHMPEEEARSLVWDFTKNSAVKRIIITLPNHAFNQFYGMPAGEFRHDDHKWEPDGYSDFFDWIYEEIDKKKFMAESLTFESIGDVVSRTDKISLEPCSFGVVLERV